MPAAKQWKSSKGRKDAGRVREKAAPTKRGDRARRTETIKFLTLDETKRLFSRIKDKRDKAIFLIAYRHGLRSSEVGLLRTDDLDLKRLKIVLHRMKGSLSGEHPLQPDETRVLKAWLKVRDTDFPILFPSRRNLPISRQMLDVLMKRYGEEANIPQRETPLPCPQAFHRNASAGCRRRPALLTRLAGPCQHPEHGRLCLARFTQPGDEGEEVFHEAPTALKEVHPGTHHSPASQERMTRLTSDERI